MKAKKRTGVRKHSRSEDAERQRKVNAAIQHAERMAKQTGGDSPVVFRPSPRSEARPQDRASSVSRPQVHRKNEASAGARRANPAMSDALRKALNIAPTPPSSPGVPPSDKGSPQPSSETRAVLPKKQKTVRPAGPTVSKMRKKVRRNATGKAAEALSRTVTTRAAKKSAKKNKKSTQRNFAHQPPKTASSDLEILTEKLRLERLSRERAKETIEISRRALNARLRAAKDAKRATPTSPFARLQKDWLSAFKILQRYDDEAPNGAKAAAARRRLDLIEAEWDRRHALRSGDPDYFPWPSTEIDHGSNTHLRRRFYDGRFDFQWPKT